MNLNEVVLSFMLYRYEILLIIFIPFLVFLIFLAFPRIEKKFDEKDKLIDEKDETLSGARGHYKELLIEVKTLKIEKEKLITENENLKQKILELEEFENKIKKITFEENRKERFKNHLKNSSNKGKEFEEFVAGHFKLDGYQISLNGIKQGKNDKGIDIICSKDEELILIQCKNWKEDSKYKINHEKLKAFVGCCTEYVNQNKLFDKNIKLKFITSNYILDESGKKFLQESKTLQYEILKY